MEIRQMWIDGVEVDPATFVAIGGETIRTPRPNKKLMAMTAHFRGDGSPCGSCVPFEEFWSVEIESLAYSNPRG